MLAAAFSGVHSTMVAPALAGTIWKPPPAYEHRGRGPVQQQASGSLTPHPRPTGQPQSTAPPPSSGPCSQRGRDAAAASTPAVVVLAAVEGPRQCMQGAPQNT